MTDAYTATKAEVARRTDRCCADHVQSDNSAEGGTIDPHLTSSTRNAAIVDDQAALAATRCGSSGASDCATMRRTPPPRQP